MNKLDEKKVNKLIHNLSLKYNIPVSNLREIVESPYEFTNEEIKENNEAINSAITEEEVEKLKTTYLYKSFFKLYISKSKLLKRNKQRNFIKTVNENRWKK